MATQTPKSTKDGIYEYVNENIQLCPIRKSEIGIMPGSRDATCHTCGFKDPCCK